jgi:hypothetical protein
MDIVNLTPHDIVFMRDEHTSTRTTYPAEPGRIARVVTEDRDTGVRIDGFPVVESVPIRIEGLPAPRDDLWLIVSGMVLAACPERDDLVAPDTGPESAIRDNSGRLQAVRRWRR